MATIVGDDVRLPRRSRRSARRHPVRPRLPRRPTDRRRPGCRRRTSSSPDAWPTPRSSSPRSSTSSDGHGTTGIAWPPAWSSGTCSSAAARSRGATTRAAGGTIRTRPHRVPHRRGRPRTVGAVITKPPGTGGMVTFDTVREQLLYEVHDPRRYLNPDVTADFTSVGLDDLGGDRVRVSGARGGPPPATYKGLVCRPAGWAGEVRLAYPWPDAEAKARSALAFVRGRAEAARRAGRGVARGVLRRRRLRRADGRAGPPPSTTSTADPPEVIGRLAWRTADAASAQRVSAEVGVLGLSGPPDDRRHRPRAATAGPPSCWPSTPSPSTAPWSTPRSASTFRPSRTVRPPWARACRVVWWCGCGRRDR